MESRFSDFRYPLQGVEIAQAPSAQRDEARLLVLDRSSGQIEHAVFRELPDLLRTDDLIVLNDTRVFPARLRARKPTGGRVEVLLLEDLAASPESQGLWRVVGRPAKALTPGSALTVVADSGITITSLWRDAEDWIVAIRRGAKSLSREEVFELCEQHGETPLPPYIHRETDKDRHDPKDRSRYQTVYASNTGAVAAPTAGLHFTEDVLARLAQRGIEVVSVTLHVGLGTFLPLSEEAYSRNTLHSERLEISTATGERIRAARRRGARIVAIGTTSVRTLESFADDAPLPHRGRTELFIKPGHRFQRVDALVTNFHLPESSTLVLTCAFAGRERLLAAYAEAIERGYRFYSYGDAMLIV